MKRFGLIGYPLKHSFSQRFFTDKFNKEGVDAEYCNFEIQTADLLPSIISSDVTIQGLNVTIPYKQDVIRFLDSLDMEAEEIGAVNVIKISREEGGLYLRGYNTDIIGFQHSIAPLIDKDKHKKALVLGTGGSSKAVIKALGNLELGYTYVSRTARENVLSYQQLTEEVIKEYTVIINCSPVGTFPNVDEAPEISYEYLTEDHLLFDLVYNPSETKFLRLGKEMGAKVKNGAQMLELQALAAWEIWNR